MPKKPRKLSPEGEVLAAHMTAMTTAIQMLVLCLEANGSLEIGQYQQALLDIMEKTKGTQDTMVLALLADLRTALLN